MHDTKIDKYEQILGRNLEDKEIQRMGKIKELFKIHDNDALWDIILIMEYYTRICEDIPKKIEGILSASSCQSIEKPRQAKIKHGKWKEFIKVIKLCACSLLFLYSGFFIAMYQLDIVVVAIRIFLLILLGVLCLYYMLMSVFAFIENGKVNKVVFLYGLISFVALSIGLGCIVINNIAPREIYGH